MNGTRAAALPETRAAVLCAWHVGATLVLSIGRGTRDVSHGICPACLVRAMDAMDDATGRNE